MNKRAQLSLFLLLGIVILVVVILILHLKSLGPSPLPVSKLQTAPLKSYVQNCVELTSKRAIINLGIQGGFIGIPDSAYGYKVQTLSIPGTSEPVVYLYNWDYSGVDRRSLFQSIPVWQDEIARYVNNNLGTCLNGFQPFIDEGYNVQVGTLKTKVTIRSNDVVVTANYPITLTKGGSKVKLQSFQSIVEVPLLKVHEQVDDIINAIYSSDNEGDKEPARAFCKQRKALGKFCPQQSIDFNFKVNRYLPYQYDFLDEAKPTTLWMISTKFSDGTPFYFIFAAAHRRENIQVS